MKSWSEIFHDVAKWPELRVYRWKGYQNQPDVKFAFLQLFRKASKPGVAKTITLSNDLVWAVSKLSFELDPLFLAEQIIAARMPFAVTVFEWNGEARRRVYEELGVNQEITDPHPQSEVPAIMATDTDGRKNLYNISYNNADKKFILFPLVAEINKNASSEINSFNALVKSVGRNTVADYLFSSAVVKRHPEAVQVDDDPRIHIRISGPVAAAVSRTEQLGGAAAVIPMLMAGTAGQFRWFGALCTLLNRPANIRYVDAPPPGPGDNQPPRKPQTASDRPQALTLMLPRDKVVQRVLRAIEHERKKTGLHEVIGHWASRHNSGAPTCAHDWPLGQPTRRQVCGSCGKVRWWKDSHRRGEGEVLKVRQRKADYSGVDVKRLVETIKQGN